jgi:subtilisin family serine protease
VQLIAKDAVVTLNAIVEQPNPPNYGLARISHRQRGNQTAYRFDGTAGAGTCAYIIDSGLTGQSNEFGNRIVKLPDSNFIPEEANEDLCFISHGTHVAGILASRSYGVAKNATIFPIKAFDQRCRSRVGAIARAISLVRRDSRRADRQAQCPKGFVLNLSLSFDRDLLLDPLDILAADLVDVAVLGTIRQQNPSLLVFPAAGNENHPASQTSPARLSAACTIGNIDINDNIYRGMPFGLNVNTGASNYGPLVKFFAPGTNILSTAPRNTTTRDDPDPDTMGPFGNFSVNKTLFNTNLWFGLIFQSVS